MIFKGAKIAYEPSKTSKKTAFNAKNRFFIMFSTNKGPIGGSEGCLIDHFGG
jgi:hypothetical protein